MGPYVKLLRPPVVFLVVVVVNRTISCTQQLSELECGPMPNVMVALPNIGGALYRKVWLTPTT